MKAEIRNISWAEYRALPAMNASTLVHGLKSMKHLQAAIGKDSMPETQAMRIGTGVHAAVLEPETLKDLYVVMPDFHLDPNNRTAAGVRTESKATRYYKDRVAEFQMENPHAKVIPQSEFDQISRTANAVLEHSIAKEMVGQMEKEVSVVGRINGLDFKGRVDLLDVKNSVIADLKTTQSCSPFLFGNVCARLHYPWKMSIYRELVRQVTGESCRILVIAQETTGVFDTAVYEIPPALLDREFDSVRWTIDAYQLALDTNEWQGVDGGNGIMPLVMPGWAANQDDIFDWEADETYEQV